MTRKTVPERSGLSATHTRDVFYGYDLRGLQTYARFDSASGEGVTNTYDGFGNRTAETLTMNGVSRTLTAGFNANGRRTSLRYPDGQTLSYTYDQLDRFHAMQLTGTGYLIYTPYYANGTVAAINRLKLSAGDWGYSDTATTYAYDLVLRLSRVTQALAGNSYDTTTTFTRNPASQIASLTRT
ncbi:hypothetical protein, partial [Tsuneonella flava]